MCQIYTAWNLQRSPQEEFDMLEYFAGCASLSMCMREAGKRTGSLDIKYKVEPKNSQRKRKHRSNPMDMNDTSGFALLNWKLWLVRIKYSFQTS